MNKQQLTTLAERISTETLKEILNKDDVKTIISNEDTLDGKVLALSSLYFSSSIEFTKKFTIEMINAIQED